MNRPNPQEDYQRKPALQRKSHNLSAHKLDKETPMAMKNNDCEEIVDSVLAKLKPMTDEFYSNFETLDKRTERIEEKLDLLLANAGITYEESNDEE